MQSYVDEVFPGSDITDFTIDEIGEWNKHEVFPNLLEINPDVFKPIDEESYGENLPYRHLKYWKNDTVVIWSCKYCEFWCDMFNQRIMEKHLCREC